MLALEEHLRAGPIPYVAAASVLIEMSAALQGELTAHWHVNAMGRMTRQHDHRRTRYPVKVKLPRVLQTAWEKSRKPADRQAASGTTANYEFLCAFDMRVL